MNPKWFGVSEDWLLKYRGQSHTWDKIIPKMKRWKFNTARLAFRFPEAVTANNYSLLDYVNNYAQLDQVLELLSQNGIKAILDCHNYKDTYGWFASSEWQQDWVSLAIRVKGDSRIVGLELANEPTPNTWDSGVATTQEFIDALGACTDAIRAAGNMHKIIYPAPWYYKGATIPSSRKAEIVIDWHLYMTDDYPNTLAGARQKVTYDLVGMQDQMKKGFSIWVGETGPRKPPINYEVEKAYVAGTIKNCTTADCGFSLWAYCLNHWKAGSYDDILATAKFTV